MAYVHKDASSASCEDLLVRIDLPGAFGVRRSPGSAPHVTLRTVASSNLYTHSDRPRAFPGTASVAELTLDVQETHIKLRSPRYKLGLYLPHKVLKDKGKAEWDAKKQVPRCARISSKLCRLLPSGALYPGGAGRRLSAASFPFAKRICGALANFDPCPPPS